MEKTDLKKILSVSGEHGLFLYLAQAKAGIIAESLETGRRTTFGAHARVSSLSDISIYTDEADISLKEVLRKMAEKLSGGERERQLITDLFVEHELDYMAESLQRKHNAATSKAFHELTGHTICVPPALKASKRAKDFLWTGTNLNDRDQNFVYYSYPWDGQPLTPEQFVAKRDSALKTNIPGSTPNQWMQTARMKAGSGDAANERGGAEVPLILTRARTLNNLYVHEVHGLWEMHNGALGGAFVSLERIDTANSRVLVTEGFIYSPHSPKRTILREMEAALRTFK